MFLFLYCWSTSCALRSWMCRSASPRLRPCRLPRGGTWTLTSRWDAACKSTLALQLELRFRIRVRPVEGNSPKPWRALQSVSICEMLMGSCATWAKTATGINIHMHMYIVGVGVVVGVGGVVVLVWVVVFFLYRTQAIACAPGHIVHNAMPAAMQTSHQDVYPLVVVDKLDSLWGNSWIC